MATKPTISQDVVSIIKKSVDEAVKKSVAAIKAANEEIEIVHKDYFKETEKLLYSLPALKLKVAQDEEDIEKGIMILKRKSKDVVTVTNICGSHCDPEIDYIERRKASMERTKREIQRIERALETIQDDEYYNIIPMKYFDNCTIEEIAEQLGKDVSTIRRNRRRLINKLKVILFGVDAL